MDNSSSIEMNLLHKKNVALEKNYYKKLEEQHGLRIEERFDWVKSVSGNMESKSYEIFALYGDQILFRNKIESSSYSKSCLGGKCQSFTSSVLSHDSDGINTFLSIKRPCACYCCFLDLPQADIFYGPIENSNSIGRVQEIFSFSQISFEVRNLEGAKYKIQTNCMQCELICTECCIKQKNDIDFDIMSNYGEHVGAIKKRVPKANLANIIIEIHFPTDASSEDKAILLSFVIFLENRLF